MSRVNATHVFLLADKPEHPLASSGLKDWIVVRTVLQPTGYCADRNGEGWVDNITFVHYVSPPRSGPHPNGGPE